MSLRQTKRIMELESQVDSLEQKNLLLTGENIALRKRDGEWLALTVNMERRLDIQHREHMEYIRTLPNKIFGKVLVDPDPSEHIGKVAGVVEDGNTQEEQ